ncbi:amidohydrolase family protein [Streptomyces boncukensis]|uniref:Amidohydrolase family protein n=1 Tax=Streptomyces boncukensis TaxID=2711219 RepID=A0A6G4WWG9_9ACTN|nr:amidohydrolase family protein [Streptomyces boncukensis]NGO69202.1 amidohydrolase family protein [Streptomyces boncukensis]
MSQRGAPVELTVDAHHHLWDPARRSYPWLAGDALAPIRRRYDEAELRARTGPGVRTVLVQTVSSAEETAEFLAVAAASDTVAGVVGWADLTAPEPALPPDPRLVGLRHQAEDEPDPEWLLRADVHRSLARLGERGLVYDLLVRPPQRRAALACARALPGVRFVLDHAGKPAVADGEWDTWARWLTAMAGCSNVTCKLSGLVAEAPWGGWDAALLRPYAEHLLAAFGADRVMFGSDWPVCELAAGPAGYGAVRTLAGELLAGCSPGERAAVLGGCARRVYRLPAA